MLDMMGLDYVEDEYGVEWAILPDDKCFEVVG
ncbi:hypothetical protein [Escherichia phage FL20]